MRSQVFMFKTMMSLFILFLGTSMMAQTGLQYFRNWDKSGVNVFEAPKADDTEYTGLKVKVGGNFTQQYQALSHENNANDNGVGGANELYALGNGFNLATANLNLDVQLGDGIRLALENYMSARHHAEFWVKGGYIQIDKLSMFEGQEWFDKYMRVKVGHFQPNYGDQQFRRSDNGNTMFNPFVGNHIVDAFTTEIGGELYVFPVDNFMVMLGLTNGLIKGDVSDVEDGKGMSLYLKAAYDKQISDDLRFRLSGSFVNNGGSLRNTLYAGDRAGSRYYLVMEGAGASAGSNFRSARMNPNFSSEVSSFQINPFVKYQGFELFGAYESGSGMTASETDARSFSQYSVEALYRFLDNESLYIGGRYNSTTGDFGSGADVTVSRYALVAGWFVTNNLLLKAEYVNQDYSDFAADDILYEGNFNGLIIEAAVGF